MELYVQVAIGVYANSNTQFLWPLEGEAIVWGTWRC